MINILEDGIPYEIDVSIDTDAESYGVTEISQGASKGTYIKINLYMNGQPYMIPTDGEYRYFIDGKRPDNSYILREANEIKDNSLIFRNISHYITDIVGDITLKLGWQNLTTGLINFLIEDINIRIKENQFYSSNVTQVDEYSLLFDSIGLIGDMINNADRIIKDMVATNSNIVSQETVRKDGEAKRVAEELLRVAQEKERQTNTSKAIESIAKVTTDCVQATTNTNNAINACNTATSNANTATTRATNAAKAAEDIISNITGINDSEINLSQTWSSSKTIDEIKGKIINTTLLVTGWGGTSPYTYTLTVSGVTATNVVEITTQSNITDAQVVAMQDAGIYGFSQTTNTIVLKASGDKPTIDLPITVIVRGK